MIEVSEHFWKRWIKELVSSWRSREKWKTPSEDIKVSEIVWLLEESCESGKWPLARVEEVFKGSDLRVRTAMVRTEGARKLRAISSLCPLRIET